MENLTHSLFGLALARAGLNRVGRGATLVMILSANAPDIDIVAAPQGALRYLEIHRGYTHCILALPAMAALSVIVTALFFFRHKLAWTKLWAIACVGVASHLFLDWTNSYGIRLLLPFSSRWFHADLNNLWDAVILVVLAVAAIWPSFAGLVSQEIGERPSRGRKLAIAALLFYLLFECGRAGLHARAIASLEARLYDGSAPIAVAALPSAVNPLSWNAVVETQNAFRDLDVNALQNPAVENAMVIRKLPVDRAITSVETTETFRYFRYFARFPAWSEQPVTLRAGQGTRVDLTDLRFGTPGGGGFHCIGLVNESGRVSDTTFTYGTGIDIDDGSHE